MNPEDMVMEDQSALREIAHLLRARIEQHERQLRLLEEEQRERRERAAEMLGKLQEGFPKLPEMPNFDDLQRRQEETDRRLDESQAQQQAFQERVAAALERHNALLEKLIHLLEHRRD